MVSEIEIIGFIIILIYSGIWAFIKAVDDGTDNKWVFLVPAGVLGFCIILWSNDSCGFIILLLALGPIVVMLIKVGGEQGKVPQKRSYSPRSNQNRKTRKQLDLNRELAPSYIRAYDRLIAYIQARGGDIKSLEDGRQRLAEIWGASDSGRFFDSPYVIKVLGLKEEVVEEKKEEIIGDDWWEEGYSVDNSDDLPKAKTGEESCGHSGCENSVSAFDFRCFTCRNRFCSEHAGSKIECNGCSK